MEGFVEGFVEVGDELGDPSASRSSLRDASDDLQNLPGSMLDGPSDLSRCCVATVGAFSGKRGVGGRTEGMLRGSDRRRGGVRHRDGRGGSGGTAGGRSGGIADLPGRGEGREGERPDLPVSELSAAECPRAIDRGAWAGVSRAPGLEQRERPLGAPGRPLGEGPPVGVADRCRRRCRRLRRRRLRSRQIALAQARHFVASTAFGSLQ